MRCAAFEPLGEFAFYTLFLLISGVTSVLASSSMACSLGAPARSHPGVSDG